MEWQTLHIGGMSKRVQRSWSVQNQSRFRMGVLVWFGLVWPRMWHPHGTRLLRSKRQWPRYVMTVKTSANKNSAAPWHLLEGLDHPATKCENLSTQMQRFSSPKKYCRTGYYIRGDMFLLVPYKCICIFLILLKLDHEFQEKCFILIGKNLLSRFSMHHIFQKGSRSSLPSAKRGHGKNFGEI